MGGPLSFGGTNQSAAPAAEPLTATGAASVQSYKNGERFYVAFEGQVQDGWHAYYQNPASVGDPMTATLEAPQGFEVSGPYWKVPTREESTIGTAYIYTKPLIIWEITPKADAPATATFRMNGTAQICSEEGCLPPSTATATVELAAGDGAPAADWADRQQSVIGPGDTVGVEVSATQPADSKTVELHLKAPAGLQNFYFFSDNNAIDPTVSQTATPTEDGYTMVLTRNDGTNPLAPLPDTVTPGAPLKELNGLLTWDGGHCRADISLAAPTAAEPPAEAAAEPASISGLLFICGSLFVGGLILNLMPCVFPVIGLKVMSFVKLGGGSRGKIIAHSLSFVAGILVSFWVIAALLLLLIPPGQRSWALWMQNGWVVYGLTVLLLVLALSMSGVFEIGVSATGAGQGLQSKGGLIGSFFQGLFVTIVATPCSAPFLGASMASAMALPGAGLLIAMTFMALGLALPYLVLGCFPSLISRLPKPGDWMELLKQGLSFLMYAAAAWFLTIYLAFVPLAIQAVIGLTLVAVAFWVYGRWCPMYRAAGTRIKGLIIALLLLAAGLVIGAPRSADDAGHPQWEAWSPEAMQEALDDGHPVFVDFTAKWCATCQYNKGVAYSEDVYKTFRDKDVVLMRADMTQPDPAITEELKRLHRSNVPVNALYRPDGEPAVTKELLSPGYLEDFLREQLKEN